MWRGEGVNTMGLPYGVYFSTRSSSASSSETNLSSCGPPSNDQGNITRKTTTRCPQRLRRPRAAKEDSRKPVDWTKPLYRSLLPTYRPGEEDVESTIPQGGMRVKNPKGHKSSPSNDSLSGQSPSSLDKWISPRLTVTSSACLPRVPLSTPVGPSPPSSPRPATAGGRPRKSNMKQTCHQADSNNSRCRSAGSCKSVVVCKDLFRPVLEESKNRSGCVDARPKSAPKRNLIFCEDSFHPVLEDNENRNRANLDKRPPIAPRLLGTPKYRSTSNRGLRRIVSAAPHTQVNPPSKPRPKSSNNAGKTFTNACPIVLANKMELLSRYHQWNKGDIDTNALFLIAASNDAQRSALDCERYAAEKLRCLPENNEHYAAEKLRCLPENCEHYPDENTRFLPENCEHNTAENTGCSPENYELFTAENTCCLPENCEHESKLETPEELLARVEDSLQETQPPTTNPSHQSQAVTQRTGQKSKNILNSKLTSSIRLRSKYQTAPVSRLEDHARPYKESAEGEDQYMNPLALAIRAPDANAQGKGIRKGRVCQTYNPHCHVVQRDPNPSTWLPFWELCPSKKKLRLKHKPLPVDLFIGKENSPMRENTEDTEVIHAKEELLLPIQKAFVPSRGPLHPKHSDNSGPPPFQVLLMGRSVVPSSTVINRTESLLYVEGKHPVPSELKMIACGRKLSPITKQQSQFEDMVDVGSWISKIPSSEKQPFDGFDRSQDMMKNTRNDLEPFPLPSQKRNENNHGSFARPFQKRDENNPGSDEWSFEKRDHKNPGSFDLPFKKEDEHKPGSVIWNRNDVVPGATATFLTQADPHCEDYHDSDMKYPDGSYLMYGTSSKAGSTNSPQRTPVRRPHNNTGLSRGKAFSNPALNYDRTKPVIKPLSPIRNWQNRYTDNGVSNSRNDHNGRDTLWMPCHSYPMSQCPYTPPHAPDYFVSNWEAGLISSREATTSAHVTNIMNKNRSQQIHPVSCSDTLVLTGHKAKSTVSQQSPHHNDVDLRPGMIVEIAPKVNNSKSRARFLSSADKTRCREKKHSTRMLVNTSLSGSSAPQTLRDPDKMKVALIEYHTSPLFRTGKKPTAGNPKLTVQGVQEDLKCQYSRSIRMMSATPPSKPSCRRNRCDDPIEKRTRDKPRPLAAVEALSPQIKSNSLKIIDLFMSPGNSPVKHDKYNRELKLIESSSPIGTNLADTGQRFFTQWQDTPSRSKELRVKSNRGQREDTPSRSKELRVESNPGQRLDIPSRSEEPRVEKQLVVFNRSQRDFQVSKQSSSQAIEFAHEPTAKFYHSERDFQLSKQLSSQAIELAQEPTAECYRSQRDFQLSKQSSQALESAQDPTAGEERNASLMRLISASSKAAIKARSMLRQRIMGEVRSPGFIRATRYSVPRPNRGHDSVQKPLPGQGDIRNVLRPKFMRPPHVTDTGKLLAIKEPGDENGMAKPHQNTRSKPSIQVKRNSHHKLKRLMAKAEHSSKKTLVGSVRTQPVVGTTPSKALTDKGGSSRKTVLVKTTTLKMDYISFHDTGNPFKRLLDKNKKANAGNKTAKTQPLSGKTKKRSPLPHKKPHKGGSWDRTVHSVSNLRPQIEASDYTKCWVQMGSTWGQAMTTTFASKLLSSVLSQSKLSVGGKCSTKTPELKVVTSGNQNTKTTDLKVGSGGNNKNKSTDLGDTKPNIPLLYKNFVDMKRKIQQVHELMGYTPKDADDGSNDIETDNEEENDKGYEGNEEDNDDGNDDDDDDGDDDGDDDDGDEEEEAGEEGNEESKKHDGTGDFQPLSDGMMKEYCRQVRSFRKTAETSTLNSALTKAISKWNSATYDKFCRSKKVGITSKIVAAIDR